MRAGHVSRDASKRPPGAFDLWEKIKLNTVIDRFPLSWRERLVRGLGRMSRDNFAKWSESVDKLTAAERGGIRPDAGDAEICTAADVAARDIADRLKDNEAVFIGRRRIEENGPDFLEAMNTLMCKAVFAERGLLDLWPAGPTITRGGALRRLCDARWWRRTLRKLHARTVEACAIGIGLVGRHAGLYASDESVKRRAGQNARNAAALESVTAVNDMLQSQTLAELAAKGTANKAIRRVELLTRIAGFELIAQGMGHQGWMVTMTCPSRFHKMTTRADGRVVPNPRYDGSTPHEAQAYLSGCWARCRAAAAREGIQWYGFRIAEPQHDATPHWHCLLFVPPVPNGAESSLVRLVTRYFLADSPNEPGAQQHRVDFEWINPAKGSAVGYVIKYVSKNIDGHGVGLDLFGNDAITSSQRVEAWASTWRIRQFQQIGGAPVGVWRELRRINPENVGDTAPDALRVAVSAVNAKGEPGVQSVAWMRYTTAQGGIGCKRKNMRLRLLRDAFGDLSQPARAGRYGEDMPAKLIGVEAAGVHYFRNHVHVMTPSLPAFERKSFALVESERCEWVVGLGEEAAMRSARIVFQRSGEAASTRIHVNNCTHRDLSRVSEFAPVREYRPRLRRFAVREVGEGSPIKEKHHGRIDQSPPF